MFDLTAYEQVRRKYKAEGAFPHLHDKVSQVFVVLHESDCHDFTASLILAAAAFYAPCYHFYSSKNA